MTPDQCRAARRLLDWSTRDLARASGLMVAAVGRWERGVRPGIGPMVAKLQAALEKAGVEFSGTEATLASGGAADDTPTVVNAPEAILAWRQRLGLSRRAAADALGVSTRSVHLWETGERPVSKTVLLACAAVEAGLAPLAHDSESDRP